MEEIFHQRFSPVNCEYSAKTNIIWVKSKNDRDYTKTKKQGSFIL